MSISWTLFKLPNFWDLSDLDSKIQKKDNLVKYIITFRYVGLKGFQHGFLIENCLINAGFLDNRTGPITAGTYLVPITEIISSSKQVGSGALLNVNNYVLGFYLN